MAPEKDSIVPASDDVKSNLFKCLIIAGVMGGTTTPVLFILITSLSYLFIPRRDVVSHANFAMLTLMGISLILAGLTIYLTRVKHWSKWLWLSWLSGTFGAAFVCFVYGCMLYD